MVAIDGSKFKAVNSSVRNFTQTKLQKRIREIEEETEIERCVDELDRTDEQEANAKKSVAREVEDSEAPRD